MILGMSWDGLGVGMGMGLGRDLIVMRTRWHVCFYSF